MNNMRGYEYDVLRPREFMNINNLQLLETMLADMAHQSHLYQPTEFWKFCSKEIVDFLRSPDSEMFCFKSWKVARDYFIPRYSAPPSKRVMQCFERVIELFQEVHYPWIRHNLEYFLKGKMEAEADYRVFQASDSQQVPILNHFSENPLGQSDDMYEFDGKNFTKSSLNYLRGLAFLKKKCPLEKLQNVIEIGGGYGILGEILLKSDDRLFYVDCDIPPLSFVSTWYLQQLFGIEKVADYQMTRNMEIIDIEDLRQKGFRSAVICPWQLPRIKGSFQLACNFISFQEMEKAVVKNYVNLINPLLDGVFLLRNLKEGKKIKSDSNPLGVNDPITFTDYLEFFQSYSMVASDSLTFGKKYLDGFHSEVMLFKKNQD